MLQGILQGCGRRTGCACKRPLTAAAAASTASFTSSSSGGAVAGAGAAAGMREGSSSLGHRALPTRRGLLRPAQPDAATTTHPARRGFCSARLMTSSSAASSSSSDGTPGFWEGPLGADDAAAALQGLLPQRQVPDSALRFTTVAYVDAGAYIPFPHADGIDPRAFGTNPANFKVTLKVYIKELGLSEREEKRLRCLVGARYNTGRQELTLTTARFLSRAHNKQYLVYLLENLVAEAKQAGGKGQ